MIVLPINGLNVRMGGLFKTPKHALLVDGVPAIKRTLDYMSQFGDIVILAGEQYYDDIKLDWLPKNCTVKKVKPTRNVIETIFQLKLNTKTEPMWIVDCDVVPVKLNPPKGSTVYCFDNTGGPNQYSNFDVEDGFIKTCNEKEEKFDYAGAGVYYFDKVDNFISHSHGCSTVSEVFANMIDWMDVRADTTSLIERIGTLPDITGGFTGNILTPTIIKNGFIRDEVKWYNHYQDKGDIPYVYDYDFEKRRMTMGFLQKDGPLNIYSVVNLVKKYREYPPMNGLQFDSYRMQIHGHLEKNTICGSYKLETMLKDAYLDPTFAHGDLSVTNIIQTKTGPKLIDPLYSEAKFGSYILDYAKLLFTLKFYNNDLGNFDLLLSLIDYPPRIDVNINLFIASECVRVATYNKKFNFIAENLIYEL